MAKIRKRYYALGTVLAVIVLPCAWVAYDYMFPPFPSWLSLPSNASVVTRQSPSYSSVRDGLPLDGSTRNQYIRVRFAEQSPESVCDTLDKILHAWCSENALPHWKPIAESDLPPREQWSAWAQSVSLPADRYVGGYYGRFENRFPLTFVGIIVVPDGTGTIAENDIFPYRR